MCSGWLDFLRESVQPGAGEIVLNSVDRDGEMSGYDLKMIRDTVATVTVPVIALGGAGRLEHFRQAVDVGAAAVSAGSMFVFQGPHRAAMISYPAYPELERLIESL